MGYVAPVEAAARTAFVTGGSGFIGGALIRRLVGDGWRVRALARSERSAEALSAAGGEPARGEPVVSVDEGLARLAAG